MSETTHGVLDDINKAAARRWQRLDSLLPEPQDVPEGCTRPFLARGDDGRLAGLAVCAHSHVPADVMAQTWGMATRFVLTLRISEPETRVAASNLLAQWREHLNRQHEAMTDDSAAIVSWPARDITGVLALLHHGLQPITVVAARPAGHPIPAGAATSELVVRTAKFSDLDVVTEMAMGVVRYDTKFGGAIPRSGTQDLVRAEMHKSLAMRPAWTWLAEQDGRPVGMAAVEPPEYATWIAGMTRPGSTAYLQYMFVRSDARDRGIGAALIGRVHDELDARRVDMTLLIHGQVNPLSAPFWHRMGYRPLWTNWEARPAAALR